MKNSIIICFLILFASCQPKKLQIANFEVTKVKHFGTIKVGDTINENFEIKNTSQNILRIKNIKTSCGCTVAGINDSIINPDSTTKIKTQFIADKENIGSIEKSIVIEANTNPNFTVLYLKGNVVGY